MQSTRPDLSSWKQFGILLRREFLVSRRNPKIFKGKIFVSIVLASFLMILFWQLPKTYAGVQDRLFALLIIGVSQGKLSMLGSPSNTSTSWGLWDRPPPYHEHTNTARLTDQDRVAYIRCTLCSWICTSVCRRERLARHGSWGRLLSRICVLLRENARLGKLVYEQYATHFTWVNMKFIWPSSFFTFCHLQLPFTCISLVAFTAVSYPAIGLNPGFDHWMIHTAAILLTSFTGCAPCTTFDHLITLLTSRLYYRPVDRFAHRHCQ